MRHSVFRASIWERRQRLGGCHGLICWGGERGGLESFALAVHPRLSCFFHPHRQLSPAIAGVSGLMYVQYSFFSFWDVASRPHGFPCRVMGFCLPARLTTSTKVVLRWFIGEESEPLNSSLDSPDFEPGLIGSLSGTSRFFYCVFRYDPLLSLPSP